MEMDQKNDLPKDVRLSKKRNNTFHKFLPSPLEKQRCLPFFFGRWSYFPNNL